MQNLNNFTWQDFYFTEQDENISFPIKINTLFFVRITNVDKRKRIAVYRNLCAGFGKVFEGDLECTTYPFDKGAIEVI
jgi:hypothetical protein